MFQVNSSGSENNENIQALARTSIDNACYRIRRDLDIIKASSDTLHQEYNGMEKRGSDEIRMCYELLYIEMCRRGEIIDRLENVIMTIGTELPQEQQIQLANAVYQAKQFTPDQADEFVRQHMTQPLMLGQQLTLDSQLNTTEVTQPRSIAASQSRRRKAPQPRPKKAASQSISVSATQPKSKKALQSISLVAQQSNSMMDSQPKPKGNSQTITLQPTLVTASQPNLMVASQPRPVMSSQQLTQKSMYDFFKKLREDI